MTFRRFLYWLARLLGDLQAAGKGKFGQRIARRSVGRLTGRILRDLFK